MSPYVGSEPGLFAVITENRMRRAVKQNGHHVVKANVIAVGLDDIYERLKIVLADAR